MEIAVQQKHQIKAIP